MKKIITTLLFTFVISLCGYAQAKQNEDIVFDAMHDEMNRSMQKLQMDDLQKPYFMSYTVYDGTVSEITAGFGAIYSLSKDDRYRIIKAEIRVGNSKFDNSLFFGDAWGEHIPQTGLATYEYDYDNIRFYLWSVTDQAYKQALDNYSKKKAFVQSKNLTELYDDLTADKTEINVSTFSVPSFDNDKWAENVKKLSSVFKKYPYVKDSGVSISFKKGTNRFMDSEGNKAEKTICDGRIYFAAGGFTDDGYKVNSNDNIGFCSADDDLPSYDVLEQKAKAVAERLTSMCKSQNVKPYIGPVIFEGNAAGKFFENLFVNNLSNPREVWKTAVNWSPSYIYSRAGDLTERLNMRVLPVFIDVYDDPYISNFEGKYLSGTYSVDDEGIKAQKLQLVKKGKLVDYYRFRAATRDFNFSNGHGRGAVSEYVTGAPGNVFVQAAPDSGKVLSNEELKNKMLRICKEQDLEYGVIVRDIQNLYSVFAAYKVYQDGHEEAFNGAQFTGVTLRALRDIMAVSDEQNVFNLAWSPSASLVAPNVLVQEMEIKKTTQKPDRKPYLEHPYFDKKHK